MKKLALPSMLIALALAGCTATPVHTTQATTPPPAAETPSPAPSRATMDAGATAKISQGATATVHSVNLDPAPEPAPQPQRPEDKWVSADIEYCAGVDSRVSAMPWTIKDTENHQFQPSHTGYNQFPQPPYAGFGEAQITAGTCTRGWVTFVVSKTATLTTVNYANQQGDSVEWRIS